MTRTARSQGHFVGTKTSSGLKHSLPHRAGLVSTACAMATAGLEEGHCPEGTADGTSSSVLLVCRRDGQLLLPDAGNIV